MEKQAKVSCEEVKMVEKGSESGIGYPKGLEAISDPTGPQVLLSVTREAEPKHSTWTRLFGACLCRQTSILMLAVCSRSVKRLQRGHGRR